MGLFDFLKKKAPVQKQQTRAAKTNSFGERLDRLTPDGELPFGWYAKHEHIFEPYETRISQAAVKLKPMKGSDRIAQLERLIALYNEYKRFCYGNGECYIKHFSDMWEHCHNSRCKDFEYITPYIAELEKLKNGKH
jgi:hypothetical protein